MAAVGSRRIRTLLCALACAGALGAAGCSSSSPAELKAAPAVNSNGKHYVYAPGSVPMTSWPKVCSLLTVESASAAIGTAVIPKAFHARCFYIPGNDAFPTLTVTILGIGSDQQDSFDQTRDNNAKFHPGNVSGVGKAAVLYQLTGSPTVNLDLLADQGLFEVALRSPVGNEASSADARSILVRVGKALAGEFAS